MTNCSREYGTDDAGPGLDMESVRVAVREVVQAEVDAVAAERKKVRDHRTSAAKGCMRAEMDAIQQDMNRTGFGSERSNLDDRHAELRRMTAETDAEH